MKKYKCHQRKPTPSSELEVAASDINCGGLGDSDTQMLPSL
jgi:hypothetical protein